METAVVELGTAAVLGARTVALVLVVSVVVATISFIVVVEVPAAAQTGLTAVIIEKLLIILDKVKRSYKLKPPTTSFTQN
jgi:hypothetical protein